MENTLIIDGIRKHCQKSKQNSECIITITESISIWHVIRIINTVGINDKIPAESDKVLFRAFSNSSTLDLFD